MADKARKKRGTSTKGADNHQSRLTEEKVAEIRRLYAAGVILKDLGRRFEVSHVSIWNVVTRKTWK